MLNGITYHYHYSTILQTGNLTLAVDFYEQSIDKLRRLDGISEILGVGYNNLGISYRSMDAYENATKCLGKAVNINRMLGGRSDGMVLSLLNFARLSYSNDGNATRVLSILDEAYNVRAQIGLKHYYTALIQYHRGRMQLSLEQFHRAAESFANAVDIFEQEEGLHPRHMASALLMWGVALKNLGRLEEAERQLTRSLKISEKVAKDNGTPNMPSEIENNIKDALRELGEVKNMMGRR